MATYSPTLIEQWADITLAARERHGATFFKKSPQAYFIDNLKAAAKKERTPPDWWRELRKQERELEERQQRSKAKLLYSSDSRDDFEKYLENEAREAFDRTTQSLITDLQKAGQTESEARRNAAGMARTHLWHRFVREHPEERDADGFQHIGSLL